MYIKYFLIAVVLIIIYSGCSDNDNIIYLPIKLQNQKMAYIDNTGKIILEDNYTNASDFYNNYAIISQDWGKSYNIINKNGDKLLKKSYKKIEHLKDDLFLLYNDRKILINLNKEKYIIAEDYDFYFPYIWQKKLVFWADTGVGILNSDGSIYSNTEYDKIIYNFKMPGKTYDFPDFAIIQKSGKEGYISYNGKIIINPIYDLALKFEDGLGLVMVDKKWGIVDTTGKILLKPTYDEIGYSPDYSRKSSEKIRHSIHEAIDYWLGNFHFNEDFARVKLNNKWGFIDKSGTLKIPILYNDVFNFSNGLAAVKLNNKWGFINKSGVFIIKPEYDTVRSYSEGLAWVKNGNNWGAIDKNNKVVIDFIYSEREDAINTPNSPSLEFKNGMAKVARNNLLGMVNKKGQVVLPFENTRIDILDNGFIEAWNDGISLYDNNLKLLISNDKYKIRDIADFVNGYAKTLLYNLTFTYIDTSGRVLIDPLKNVNSASDFHNSIAQVQILENSKTKIGYLNTKGEWIYKPH